MIVNRENVRKRAEVFTQQKDVDAMLDMVSDEDGLIKYSTSVLDPAIGYGAFLDEVISRKLKWLDKHESEMLKDKSWGFYYIEVMLANSCGVDINEYSVKVSRRLIAERIISWMVSHWSLEFLDVMILHQIRVMLEHYIVVGDFITGLTPEGKQIWFLPIREKPVKKTRRLATNG